MSHSGVETLFPLTYTGLRVVALRVLYIAGSSAATLATVFNQPVKVRLSLVSLLAGCHTGSVSVTHSRAGATRARSGAERGRVRDCSDARLFSF